MALGGAGLRATCAPVIPTSNRHLERKAASLRDALFCCARQLRTSLRCDLRRMKEVIADLIKFEISVEKGVKAASLGW